MFFLTIMHYKLITLYLLHIQIISNMGNLIIKSIEAAVRRCVSKQVFLKIPQHSQENTRWTLTEGLQLYQKEIPTQVFSGEYWEIFKNTFFYTKFQTHYQRYQSFPNENHCECYKKLASRSWPVLFILESSLLLENKNLLVKMEVYIRSRQK